MKMRTLRKLQKQSFAPIRPRRRFDLSDVSTEPEHGPAPEAVFDRVTGPYGRGAATAYAFDEET